MFEGTLCVLRTHELNDPLGTVAICGVELSTGPGFWCSSPLPFLTSLPGQGLIPSSRLFPGRHRIPRELDVLESSGL